MPCCSYRKSYPCVKLRGVHVLSNLGMLARTAFLMQNYDAAATIIDNMFDQLIPPDMQHLTNLMRSDFASRALYPIP